MHTHTHTHTHTTNRSKDKHSTQHAAHSTEQNSTAHSTSHQRQRTAQHSTAQHSTAQHSTAQHSTAHSTHLDHVPLVDLNRHLPRLLRQGAWAHYGVRHPARADVVLACARWGCIGGALGWGFAGIAMWGGDYWVVGHNMQDAAAHDGEAVPRLLPASLPFTPNPLCTRSPIVQPKRLTASQRQRGTRSGNPTLTSPTPSTPQHPQPASAHPQASTSAAHPVRR